MAKVNTYLAFNGNCEEAFNFYKSVFGGEFSFVGRFKDMPPIDGQSAPAHQGEKIMHITLPISTETCLMGCDSFEFLDEAAAFGTNMSISITSDDQAEAVRLFDGLSADGMITLPIGKTFWSPCFGMVTDKFGIQWLVGV